MSKAPSMPIFWDAYLADTTHLTLDEHGAYLLLLAAMWRREGEIPNDDKDNARILGVTVGKFKKLKTRLEPFLIIDKKSISQKKLKEIWQKTQRKIDKNASNGRLGGRPKSDANSNENNDLAKANGFDSLNPNESIPEPEPMLDTDVSNLERGVASDGPPPETRPKSALTTEVKSGPRTGARTGPKATRLPEDWRLGRDDFEYAKSKNLSPLEIQNEAEKFYNYWTGKAGKDATKTNWQRTWRNWILRSTEPSRQPKSFRERDAENFDAAFEQFG